jgi:hypothetical protein
MARSEMLRVMRHERDKVLEEYREMKMALYLKQYPSDPSLMIQLQQIMFRRIRHEELEAEARAEAAEARAEAAEARAADATAAWLAASQRADRARADEEEAREAQVVVRWARWEEEEYGGAYDYHEMESADDECYERCSKEQRARFRKKVRRATDLLFDHKDCLPDKVYLKVCNVFKYAWELV